MTNQQAAELTEPGIGPLHDPAALVASQFASVFTAPVLVVLSIRHDQLDAAAAQSLAQRIGVVAAISNHAFRFLPRASFRPGVRGLLRRWLPQA